MKKLALILLSVALAGCSSSDDERDTVVDAPESCSVSDQNKFVYDVLNDTYFWYKQVPDIDPDSFESPEAVLERVKEDVSLDRFSYITDAESHDSFFEEGTYVGFGFSSILTNDNSELTLRYVFDDSAAGDAGLRRTDKIIAIDGVSIADLVANGQIDDAFGEAEEGIERTLTVVDSGDNEFEITLVKSLVTMNTVLAHNIIESGNQKYGYFAFSSFIEPSEAELTHVFTIFRDADVDEVVMDLRYNGGGRISTASHLSSLLGGDSTIGKIVVSFIHNDKYSHWDESREFEDLSVPGYSRITVLTTQSSCSASEMTINALNPFLDVNLVGSATCGKPVGMYGAEFCGKRIQPIEFQTVNHEEFGDYFDGFQPHCGAEDDLGHLLGDPDETMLAQALQLADTGSCGPTKVNWSYEGKQARESYDDRMPHKIAPYNVNQ